MQFMSAETQLLRIDMMGQPYSSNVDPHSTGTGTRTKDSTPQQALHEIGKETQHWRHCRLDRLRSSPHRSARDKYTSCDDADLMLVEYGLIATPASASGGWPSLTWWGASSLFTTNDAWIRLKRLYPAF